jgi:hypothetical protein
VAVGDASGLERARQDVLSEVRIVPGFRHGADVDDKIDAVLGEERDEVLARPVRMADGEDGRQNMLLSAVR